MRKRFLIYAACLGLLAAPSVQAQQPSASEPGKWAFQPDADQFSQNALLDLRSLNEKTAGDHGFIQVTPGGDFAFADGTPQRFWAVDEYAQEQDNDALLAHKARWLAKRGVNMVRYHFQIAPDQPGSQLTDVNRKALDRAWRLVAAMKKEGIYTTLSPYWGVHVTVQASWGVPGGKSDNAAALIFWDPTLQKGYKAWMATLYGTKNPYTGIPLAKDPAVGIIQIQNEDSMLFWTMQGIKGAQLAELAGQYGAWLTKQYGSLAKANDAWGGDHPGAGDFQDNQGDDPASGKMGLYIVWHWTQTKSGYQAKRLTDQLAFFGETMRRFNAEIVRSLRDDLGCRQVVNPGNWRTADGIKLFDVERYSYSPGEVMGVNRYFDSVHNGPDNGWAIRTGDKFTNNSVVTDPRGMPTSAKQVAGRAFIIPETEWVAPNGYQSEGPFLTAAYQSLSGVDISYFFTDGDVPEWQPPFLGPYGNWQPPTGKWSIATPMQLGQFPAAALIFRKGYLERGKPVVHEERALDDLWTRRSPLIAEEGGYDPNRDAGDLPPRSAVKTGVNPLAFLVGPVETVYGGDPAKSRVADLKPYLLTDRKTVVSETGQIRLNYGTGVCVVNAPNAQGATGFLAKAGPLTLSDITLRCANDYATVSVVSMDGQPLKSSKKILVQIGTVAHPTGWKDKDATWQDDHKNTVAGKEVVDTGRNPWQIVETQATLSVRNPGLKTATLVDANGMAAGTVLASQSGVGLSLTLPPNALYVILQ